MIAGSDAGYPTPERGGVLLRATIGGSRGLIFVPADVASQVSALSAVTEIAGVEAPAVGLALAEGRVVTVLSVGDPPASRTASARAGRDARYRSGEDWPVPGSDRAVLCDLGSEVIALIGGEIVATGLFEDDGESGVMWRGEKVPRLDVRALYARAEAAIWAARAASRQGAA